MNKILTVLKYELLVTLRSIWFPIYALGVPLVAILLFMGVFSSDGEPLPQVAEVQGFVDKAGIIKSSPEELPQGMLIPFDQEEDALLALESNTISGFFVIPEDYIKSGRKEFISHEIGLHAARKQSPWMDRVLRFNLVGENMELGRLLTQPMDLKVKSMDRKPYSEEEINQFRRVYHIENVRYVPEYAMFIFYIIVCISGGQLLKLISKERKQRVMEVLITSVSPEKLLYGKVISQGLLALIQGVIWIVTGYTLLHLSGWTSNLEFSIHLPPTILFWWIAFFVFGFAVYACLFAGIGALTPDLKASPMVQFIVILPLVCPILPWEALDSSVNQAFTIGWSFFPLTSSMMMIKRIAQGPVPLWQILLSLLLLLLTAIFIVRTAGAMFRANNLLSSEPFSVRRYTRQVLGMDGK